MFADIEPNGILHDTNYTMAPSRAILAELARASTGGLLTVAGAAKALGVSPHDAAVKLGRLERSGWLARARRGLYLVLPLETRPGTAPVAEDPWVLANALFAPCYIGGWTAAEHWGLTEQLFRSTFVASAATTRHGTEVLAAAFHVVRVRDDRLRGIGHVWRAGLRVATSDRERTIVDALVHPHWVGGVRHLVEILRTHRASAEWSAKRLMASAEKFATGSAFKRLGFLAERLWPKETGIAQLAYARRTAGVIRLDPAVKSRGTMSKRWGLWLNVNVEAGGDS